MPENFQLPKIAEDEESQERSNSAALSSDLFLPGQPPESRPGATQGSGGGHEDTHPSCLPSVSIETPVVRDGQQGTFVPPGPISESFNPELFAKPAMSVSPAKPDVPVKQEDPAGQEKPVKPFVRQDARAKAQDPEIPGRNDETEIFDPEKLLDGPVAPGKTIEQARKFCMDEAARAGIDIKKVAEYMRVFEGRAADSFLTPQQIASTYENVGELFAYRGNKQFSAQETNRLGLDALFNVAYNRRINQTSHDTCNVSVVEVYTASRKPDKYTSLIKQIATTGEWRSEGGVIHPPTGSLTAGIDEKSFTHNNPSADARNHASLIVQNTLINAVFELGKYVRSDAGGKAQVLKYKFITGALEESREKDESGQEINVSREDRLLDQTGKPVLETKGPNAGGIKRDPGFNENEIQEAAQIMLGHKMPFLRGPWRYSDALLQANVDRIPSAQEIKQKLSRGPLSIEIKDSKDGRHLHTITNAMERDGRLYVQIRDEFMQGKPSGWVDWAQAEKEGPARSWRTDLPDAKTLETYKSNKQLPLGVHTAGGQHVQTIHDVAVRDGKCWVLVDNQHGDKTDGWITLDELHSTELYNNIAQPVRETPGGKIKNADASYRPPVEPRTFIPTSNPAPYYHPSLLPGFKPSGETGPSPVIPGYQPSVMPSRSNPLRLPAWYRNPYNASDRK